MRTYLTASSDATIYQKYPTYNSGLDEILEIGKLIRPLDSPAAYASASARALINFDISNISTFPTTSKFYLNLQYANAEKVNRYQRIEVYPISSSWVEGSGYRYQDVVNAGDGVSWEESDTDVRWQTSGSDYITSISSSVLIDTYPPKDIKIDVTNIMLPFITNTSEFDWNGLLIKFPNSDETNSANRGNIKVFSKDTHTIYPPTIEVAWNSQTFITGSILKQIPNSSVSVLPKNLKESYTLGEVDKVYFVVRDLYPEKQFQLSFSRYANKYYLPSESYFRITDEVSGVKLYDFDSYSAIDCDATGSYILLNTSGLSIDRFYKLEIKIVTGSLVFFPEFNYSFKVDSNG